MEFRHLRSFLAVAEHLHFRRAAESIHLSEPALSVQIRALEEEIEIDEGEAEIGFYAGAGLELEDVLREFVLLAMPMQRLCRTECLGRL